MAYIGRTTDGFGVRQRFVFTPNAGTTSISGNDVSGATLTFSDSVYMDVFLNGVLLKAGTDYNTNTANTIAGLTATVADDEVTVLVYDIFTTADMVSATSGGTFSGRVDFTGGIGGSGGNVVLKNTDTSDDSFPTFTFQTGDTDIAQDDVLGRILFQAPDEGSGTDAVLASARIQAFSTGDFSSSSNSTGLEFRTVTSAAVGTAGDGTSLTLLPDHQLNLKALPTVDATFPTFELQTGETTIETNDIIGAISFKAPDESSGTDAITQAAFITARASADFTASVNSTKLQFGVGSSGSATTRMTIEPDGDVSIDAGNLVIGTSGKGIDFGITSDESGSSSELLDDYEEGIITVGTNMGGGTLTLDTTNNHLIYTKIGRVVYITGAIQMASESGTSGQVFQLTGMPFSGAGDYDGLAGRSVGYISHDGATVTDGDDLVGVVNEGGAVINVYRQNENGHNLGGGQVDSNSVLYFNFHYFTT